MRATPSEYEQSLEESRAFNSKFPAGFFAWRRSLPQANLMRAPLSMCGVIPASTSALA